MFNLEIRIPRAPLLFLCILLIQTTFLPGCDRLKRYTDVEHVQRAKEFQDKGRVQEAVIELKNALQKNPSNAEARWLLGELYVAQDLGAEAEKELKRAQDLGVNPETLKVLMGKALLQQGFYTRVLTEISPSSNTSPANTARILELQGRAQLGLGKLSDGCSLFEKALQLNPSHVPSQWGLTRCAVARGDTKTARTIVRNALKLEEKNSDTWVLLGDLERSDGQLKEAENAYTTALKHKSNNLLALLGRATTRIQENRLVEANEDIELASKFAKTHPAVTLLRGILQYRKGEFAEAKTSFEMVVKVSQESMAGVLWLGLSNYALKNYEQAAQQFAQFSRGVPHSIYGRALLAATQAKLGRAQEAQETLKSFHNLDTDNPQSLAALAQAYTAVNQGELAAKLLIQAVEKSPEAADLRMNLAASLAQRGDMAQAIEQLEKAVQINPNASKAEELLVLNLVRAKQFDKALATLSSLEKKQPNNPLVYNLRGTVYLGKNDLANARKNFEQALGLDRTSIAAAMNLAQLDLTDKKPEAAKQRFKAVLAKDKNNLQAMISLAEIAFAYGDKKESVVWLEQAAKSNPGAYQPRLLLIGHYLQGGNKGKALTLAQELESAYPNNPEVQDAFGQAQLANGQKDGALRTYQKLATLLPESPVPQIRLATMHTILENASAATNALRRALELKPDYLEAQLALASLAAKGGRYLEAQTLARQIQSQRPKVFVGYELEGDLLVSQKKYVEAIKAYELGLSTIDNSKAIVKVYAALRLSGKAKEADDRISEWLAAHPQNTAVRVYLAQAYGKDGQHKRAIEQYQLVLKKDPGNFSVLNNLAWSYQQEKDPQALKYAEQAYKLKPDNVDIVDTFGWILVEQGQFARGVELLKKAQSLAPQSTEIRYHLAVGLAKSGDKIQARKELEQLLASGKSFPRLAEAKELLKQL
jgi:putative PEP-CTERM system TPR-repeat lipoprotein